MDQITRLSFFLSKDIKSVLCSLNKVNKTAETDVKNFLFLLSYSVNFVACAESKCVYDMSLLALFCISLHKYYIRQNVIYEMMSHSIYIFSYTPAVLRAHFNYKIFFFCFFFIVAKKV